MLWLSALPLTFVQFMAEFMAKVVVKFMAEFMSKLICTSPAERPNSRTGGS